jgi:hypothetical protein
MEVSMNLRNILTSTMLGAALLCSAALVALAQQEYQPNMGAALQHLREAEQELQRASSDKGGHRVQAIQLINQAEREVQAGIDFDSQHRSAGEQYGGQYSQYPVAGQQGRDRDENRGQVRITNGPVVESVSDRSATIAWSTNLQGSSRVEYGLSPNNLTEIAESPWGQGGLTHRVQINNLKPNTTYYFEVETGQARGTGTEVESQRVQSFRTLPPGSGTVRSPRAGDPDDRR